MKVEVCLTPDLIHQHELKGKIAVVVDIFRATSCMVTGLNHDVKSIYPVATVEECLAHGEKGRVTAGERGGQKIPEFDIGNSPFEYMEYGGKEIAATTTNGTMALEKSKSAEEVLVAAFLNLTATSEYLQKKNLDVLIHCAGWKGTPCIEDTLFAGALIDELDAPTSGDSALMAYAMYREHKDDLLMAGNLSGHAQRLAGFGITEDITFCMQKNLFEGVCKLSGEALTKI